MNYKLSSRLPSYKPRVFLQIFMFMTHVTSAGILLQVQEYYYKYE